MAIPTIPTSFAPRPAAATQRRQAHFDMSGVLDFISYFIFGCVVLLALGVFLYDRVLEKSLDSRNAMIGEAEKAIDPVMVEEFVRLRDRLDAGYALLNKHVTFSNFFTAFSEAIPTGVQFISLHTSVDTSNTARIEGTGIAKNFNTLAAASTAFSTRGHVKDVIFSNIRVLADNSVSFSLSGTIDQKIIISSP